jgi:hypothetical protein
MIANLFSSIGRLWCRLVHPAPMWPVSGYYICPACLRRYPVLWEPRHAALVARAERARELRRVQPLPAFLEQVSPRANS